MRETLENIVVAFILAFVFRAFIVEAFIIPTGSMAPTLYGEHLTNTCSTCGYQYAVGIIAEQAARLRSINQPLRLRCPNCDTLFDSFSPVQVAQPDSGDRIVVHKWPFDVAADYLGAKRWDVIVFKDPRDGTTNFIKRLVGLPGEVLEIIDGDVYRVPLKDLKPELLQAMDKLREDVYQYRLSAPSSRGGLREPREEFQKRYAEINKQLLPLMRIQRKSPHQTRAQQSLWFTVYNQDLLPNYEPRASVKPEQRVRWEPADNTQTWNTNEREIRFDSDGQEPRSMKFTGKPVDDFYAYNLDGAYYERREMRQPVGDLRLHLTWFPDSGNGGFRMSMNRDQDTFIAEVNVDGSVSVRGILPESDLPGHKVLVGEKKLEAFAPGRAVDIEFSLLDYRVYLFVNGEEVITSNDSQYAPGIKKLARFIEAAQRLEDVAVEVSDVKPSEIEISAWNLHCRMRHVTLERDVYYRSQRQMQPDGTDEHNQTVLNPYYNWPGWGTAGFPIMLRPERQRDGKTLPGEYFMCGDNSPASKDSRLWWEIGPHLRPLGSEYQVGTVPEDQLIGQAFFVYWPAGLRSNWMSTIGWIPNVGRMRWIR